MTYYLGKVGRVGARLVSSCKDLYNDVNAAYLTGATDVIVVKQKDGTLKSTPFHVRFGKLGVLRTGDLKEVEIEVNGTAVKLTMNIDETGKVFFCHTKPMSFSYSSDSDKDHIVVQLEAGEHGNEQPTLPKHRSESLASRSLSNRQRFNIERVKSTSNLPSSFPPGVASFSSSIQTHSIPIAMPAPPPMVDALMSSSMPDRLEVLSDSALETIRLGEHDDDDDNSNMRTALSDTEVEVKERRSAKFWEENDSILVEKASMGETSISSHLTLPETDRHEPHKPKARTNVDPTGFWGALTRILKRRHYQRFVSIEDGIYLDDIDYASMDPEELSKFFPSSTTSVDVGGSTLGVEATGIGSSGIGSSPTQSLSPSQSLNDLGNPVKDNLGQLISTLDGISFSLCGGLAQGTVTEDTFQSAYVPFIDFCAAPQSVLSSPDLVVRVDGKFYSWLVAAPLIISAVAYLQVLPQKVQDKMEKMEKPSTPKKDTNRQSFWNFWVRGQKDEMVDATGRAKSEGASPTGSPQKWKEESEGELTDGGQEGRGNDGGGRGTGVVRERRNDSESMLSSDEDGYVGETESTSRPRQRSLRRKKVGFTNNLTSKQLESLNLQPGANKVVFSITTKYQGTAKARCSVYLWDYHDKIVVSDIDGTITRSDVAGQVLPLLGMDWTQNGVVELFNAISRNSYKIVYLSARAIGQASYTKEFLRKVRRGPSCLPDGPLFLFPFSLYKAFRKEVIERRPEEFKINCLKQIRAIFPESFSPFHAGFGNKHNDVKSYMDVGIPESRIFTVNHKGILRHELSLAFQSSYMYLVTLVDRQFPPLYQYTSPRISASDSCCEEEDFKEEYSTFNYWRTPIEAELLFSLPDLS